MFNESARKFWIKYVFYRALSLNINVLLQDVINSNILPATIQLQQHAYHLKISVKSFSIFNEFKK